MPPGAPMSVGTGYSANAQVVVTRPILRPSNSVNHRAPSGPAVISYGRLLAVGTPYSVTTPPVEMRPMLLSLDFRFRQLLITF